MRRVVPNFLVTWFLNHARTLEHPVLFKWICVIFLLNLVIPDPLPFVDELLMGLATLYLGTRKRKPGSSDTSSPLPKELDEVQREKPR